MSVAPRSTARGETASHCENVRSGTPFPQPKDQRANRNRKAPTAAEPPASTQRLQAPQRTINRLEKHGAAPLATTNAPTSSTAPPPRSGSGSGPERLPLVTLWSRVRDRRAVADLGPACCPRFTTDQPHGRTGTGSSAGGGSCAVTYPTGALSRQQSGTRDARPRCGDVAWMWACPPWPTRDRGPRRGGRR